MNSYFGYIRVSTTKQGEQGVSLQEQREAIARYAQRENWEIVKWFEERETAAKRGRPVFNQMLKLLRTGRVVGVIIHKIDRGARNLKDWADLGELIDQGVKVRFANEGLDLNSRGGRLSADIQAVVAADYIRNLREEIRKGFYGRIKQGIYPLPAPLGYTDKGRGKPKEPDPVKAPLVRKAFELYGTGRYNLDSLVTEMNSLGLRNRLGKEIAINRMSWLLNDPFYMGLIRLRKTNEIFPGIHQPLVTKSLFDRVQRILNGKTNTRVQKHDFLFRRLLTCQHCKYSLIGEIQKGHVYYRCQTRNCPTICIREEEVERQILDTLSLLQFSEEEKKYAEQGVIQIKEDWGDKQKAVITALNLKLYQLRDRLARLTDAYIDRLIDKSVFEERNSAHLMERLDLEEKITQLKEESLSVPDLLSEFLERAGSAYNLYKTELTQEKRDLLKIVTSNRLINGKNVDITLSIPFNEVANRSKNTDGAPYRDIPRTWDPLLSKLTDWFKENPSPLTKDVTGP